MVYVSMVNKLRTIIALTGIIMIITGGILLYYEHDYFKVTSIEYYSLFDKNGNPRSDLTLKDVKNVEKRLNNVSDNKKEKEKIFLALEDLKIYLRVEENINSIYSNNVLLSTVTIEDINNLKKIYETLPANYKQIFSTKLQEIEKQKNEIDTIEKEILALFLNSEKTDVNSNVTKDLILEYRNKLSLLPQKDVVDKNNTFLDTAVSILNNKEAEERRKQEEEAKKQEAIKKAWVILNVPYISQNRNNVLNGCEAASLLMALQYKGYLKSMNLYEYSQNMPKSSSNNAYEGFTHDIFGLYPTDVPHWIAPAPLANYGIISSGNQNIIDATGWSLTQLNNEIINNNPVVIYATSKFKTPKQWIEGAPKNIHVQLLTGYNKITGQQIITDPWTYDDGRTSWTLSKAELESVYNAVGKKAVVIR